MKKICVALAIISLTGCASIVNDKNQKVTISASNGQEIKGTIQDVTTAQVKNNGKIEKQVNQAVSGSFAGKPADVMIERSNVNKVIVVENTECEKETPLKHSVSPMFFGNILIGGLLGSTTDASTQKMWQYDEKVTVNCK